MLLVPILVIVFHVMAGVLAGIFGETAALAFFDDIAYGLIAAFISIMFIFLAQLFLFLVILALNLLRFGAGTDVGATSLIRVTAEATPQGSWEVELFPARGFAHSDIYKDPGVARRLADWVFVTKELRIPAKLDAC